MAWHILQRHRGYTEKGLRILQEGAGSGKGRAGRVWMSCLHLSLGSLGPPGSETAKPSVLGSEPNDLFHCLFWPPSWSTGKRAGEAGFWSCFRVVIAVHVLYSGVLVGRWSWLLPHSRVGGRENVTKTLYPLNNYSHVCWNQSWGFPGQPPQPRRREYSQQSSTM